MGEHTLILIILSTLILTVGFAAYTLGKLLRTLASRAVYISKLEEHDRMIRANSALIHAIAEDYEPDDRPAPYTRPELQQGLRLIR